MGENRTAAVAAEVGQQRRVVEAAPGCAPQRIARRLGAWVHWRQDCCVPRRDLPRGGRLRSLPAGRTCGRNRSRRAAVVWRESKALADAFARGGGQARVQLRLGEQQFDGRGQRLGAAVHQQAVHAVVDHLGNAEIGVETTARPWPSASASTFGKPSRSPSSITRQGSANAEAPR
jgi:hypothetical protein